MMFFIVFLVLLVFLWCQACDCLFGGGVCWMCVGGGGGGGVMVETCYRSKFYSLFVTLAYFDSQNKDWTF